MWCWSPSLGKGFLASSGPFGRVTQELWRLVNPLRGAGGNGFFRGRSSVRVGRRIRRQRDGAGAHTSCHMTKTDQSLADVK